MSDSTMNSPLPVTLIMHGSNAMNKLCKTKEMVLMGVLTLIKISSIMIGLLLSA
jgi:hypothetical protein